MANVGVPLKFQILKGDELIREQVVTEAVIGFVESLVTVVVALPLLLAASVTQTRMVLLPSVRELPPMLLATVFGWLL